MKPETIITPGDRVPNFRLPDQTNARRSFYHEMTGGPILLLVGDSASASGVGEALSLLQERNEALRSSGIDLFGILGVEVLAVAGLAQSLDLSFPVFADGQKRTTDALLSGSTGVGQQKPALRLIALDRNQRVLTMEDGTLTPERLDFFESTLKEEITPKETPQIFSCPAPVMVLPRTLPPRTCKELIGLWHNEHHEGGFSDGKENTYDPDKKKTLEHVIREDGLRRRLNITLARRIAPELAKVFAFRRPFQFDVPVVMCYQPDRQDFFGLHRDDLRPQNRRIFAMSLNLNDDFEGGELLFPEYSPHGYKMPAGAACIFACGLLHEARPVTRGRRFVLTNFFCETEAAGAQGGEARRRAVKL